MRMRQMKEKRDTSHTIMMGRNVCDTLIIIIIIIIVMNIVSYRKRGKDQGRD